DVHEFRRARLDLHLVRYVGPVQRVGPARIHEPEVLAQPVLGGLDRDLPDRHLPPVDPIGGPIAEDELHRLADDPPAKPHLRVPALAPSSRLAAWRDWRSGRARGPLRPWISAPRRARRGGRAPSRTPTRRRAPTTPPHRSGAPRARPTPQRTG